MADEYITINSVRLDLDGAWGMDDLTPFLGEGEYRGEDRLLPGVAGSNPRPRVLGPLDILAVMYVFGVKDETGTAHSDRRLGLRDNIEYLRGELLPPYAGNSTTIVHTFSDAATRSGTCIVNEFRIVGSRDVGFGRVADTVLDITITSGSLT